MFSARTNQSGKLKALVEVLFSNATDVVLSISKSGITSEFLTVHNATICASMPASGFDEYVYTYDEPMYIGLGAHVNTFFKSLKNKTVVTLSITPALPYVLSVLVTGADCSVAYNASFMAAQNVCPISTPTYDSERHYSVATSTFSSMCKSFERAMNVSVSQCEGQLTFSSEIAGIAQKSMTFGVRDQTLMQSNFFQQYKPETLRRISKLASFSEKPLMLFVTDDPALVIYAESQLGTVRVVVNSGSLE